MRTSSFAGARVALAALLASTLAACQDGSHPTAPRPDDAGAALAALGSGTETPLVTNPALQTTPAIAGSRMVYMDDRNGGNRDLYLFDLLAGTDTRLVADASTQQNPDISGEWVVYEDMRTGGLEIRGRSVLTGEDFQISPASPVGSEFQPAVSDSLVVYGTNRADDKDIFLYNLNTRTEVPLRADGGVIGPKASSQLPDISGRYVVWEEHWGGMDDNDIMVHDLATGTTRQITGPAAQVNASVDGNRVVYEDLRNGNWEIYVYDLLSDTETRITSNPAKQTRPGISGDVVAWEDHRHGQAEIYAFDLATGKEYRITSNGSSQLFPAVSGDRIVWHDNRNGNADLYLYAPLAAFAAAR